MEKINLGFLASHNGSNVQAIIDACKSGMLNAHPAVVISNNPDSYVLQRAKNENIPAYHLAQKQFKSEFELNKKSIELLKMYDVHLVVLAGYMKKIDDEVIATFKNRIVNIHPALLPKYGGKGMYGMNVHSAVFDNKDKVSGATVHLVTSDYDEGLILAQKSVDVSDCESAVCIAERVQKLEHLLYAETIQNIITGKIYL